jgi:serine/threonine protein kinase
MTLPKNHLLRERYLIKEVLGQSGMGRVYLADDIVLKVQVAIKENLYTTADHSRQFRKEATILAKLRHPALPRVIDHFILEGLGEYLVMDYIPGEDLVERLARNGKPLAIAETVEIAREVCDALAYLQQCKPPIVHRDVKPANIKISRDGSIHLVDFGLAKEYQDGELTTTGAQGITPGYSPVEQYAHGTDYRSDIYALGATLYNALTNTQPLDALERAMGSDQIVPIKALNRSFPDDIASVIEKAMSLKPEDRFANVQEFKEALLGAIALTQPGVDQDMLTVRKTVPIVEAVKPVTLTQAPRVKKAAWLAWFIPILVVLAAGATGITFLVRGLASRVTPAVTPTTGQPVVVSQSTNTLQPEPTATSTPLPEPTETQQVVMIEETPTETQVAVIIQPMEEVAQLAFVSEREGGIPQVWLVGADGSGLTRLTSEPEGACQPAWSPDGTRLVYISPCQGRTERYAGATLIVLDLATKRTDVISQFRTGDYDPDWSPDGSKIAFTSLQTGRPQVHIYEVATRAITRLMNRATESRQPAWSSDGTQIAFVAPHPTTNHPQVWLVASRGIGEPRLLKEGVWNIMLHPAWRPGGNTVIFDLGTGNGLATFAIGGEIMNLLLTISEPETPAYSSNFGAWIAFTGKGSSRDYELYVMQGDLGALVLASDPAEDYQPAWKP